ncbi:PREDICTED: translation initiation factor IF-2-like [Chinchilla lanigera]|uniref:translation initiation factor IF-2-like n=1 Tax=Chinchilla lanigera TaxID=34839 RepID=UPI0006980A21|nr:PREDICTED: translation initiation factor IF-2-like [Chinchilla lanigera]
MFCSRPAGVACTVPLVPSVPLSSDENRPGPSALGTQLWLPVGTPDWRFSPALQPFPLTGAGAGTAVLATPAPWLEAPACSARPQPCRPLPPCPGGCRAAPEGSPVRLALAVPHVPTQTPQSETQVCLPWTQPRPGTACLSCHCGLRHRPSAHSCFPVPLLREPCAPTREVQEGRESLVAFPSGGTWGGHGPEEEARGTGATGSDGRKHRVIPAVTPGQLHARAWAGGRLRTREGGAAAGAPQEGVQSLGEGPPPACCPQGPLLPALGTGRACLVSRAEWRR